jgi:AraC-like DNA-binding protein
MGDVRLSGGSAEPKPDPTVVRFSTTDYAPKDRLAAWCEVYGQTLCKQEIEPDDAGALRADVVFRRLPGLSIMTGDRSPAIYRRKASQVDGDNLFMTIALSGHFEAEQLGRSAMMGPGDALVGTGGEPIVARVSEGFRSLTLSVPSQAMAPAVARLDTTFGRCISGANPSLRLLTRYVELLETADELAIPELQTTAVKHIHELLALTLGATHESVTAARLGGGRAARLREIKADIEAAIGREDITVAALAARHRLPVRYIQRLFEAEGLSFTEFVVGRRLAKAHALLTDRRFAELPIGSIALEVGFANQSYFNRSFRGRYGASPSEVRAGDGHTGFAKAS